MGRETILVVDDSEHIQEFLTEFLGKNGFNVLVAADGEEAIRVLEREPVDVLLTDLNMPGVTGMDLVRHAHEHHPDLIVVIMTGYASLETAREAIVYGVLDYVFKPFKSAEIVAAVEGSLERVRLRRENDRLRDAVALSSASQQIAAAAPRRYELARNVVTAALGQTGARFGALLVLNEDRGWFELRYSNAPDAEQPGGYFVGSTFPREAFACASQGVLLVTANGPHPLACSVQHMALADMTCPHVVPVEQEALLVPLRAHGEPKGVLVLSKERGQAHFAASDLAVISIIADLGATSVDNARLVINLEQAYVNTLISLNIMLEAKHPYTKGHTQRVVELCMRIGRHVGLSSGELQDLREGAMLHDIGKIAISDAILNKPGLLAEHEIESVRQHPVIGDNIIRPIKFLQHCRPVVRHHHERWDGGGYPDGLKGTEIHRFARICTIADAVDAMASERSYRPPLSFPELYDQVLMGSGTQFDENLVKIVLGMIERGEVTHLGKPRKLAVG
jgi:response regulator RpfG family c-di-GMP phosphodiesterase